MTDIQFLSKSPSDALSDIVKSFFIISYDSSKIRKDFLLPDGFPTVFYIDTEEPFELSMREGEKPVIVNSGFYIAYSTAIVEFSHRGIHVVGASCLPLALALLFENGLHEISNKFIRLTDIVSDKPDPKNAPNELIKILSDYLSARLKRTPLNDNLFAIYRRLMTVDNHQYTVQDIADWMGCSTRHLRDVFQKNLGMSPKKFLQLVRFNRVLIWIENSSDEPSFSQVAHACGYYDQAHFIRDFKKICGRSPKSLAEINSTLASKFRLF